jgi:hypothetical protein
VPGTGHVVDAALRLGSDQSHSIGIEILELFELDRYFFHLFLLINLGLEDILE